MTMIIIVFFVCIMQKLWCIVFDMSVSDLCLAAIVSFGVLQQDGVPVGMEVVQQDTVKVGVISPEDYSEFITDITSDSDMGRAYISGIEKFVPDPVGSTDSPFLEHLSTSAIAGLANWYDGKIELVDNRYDADMTVVAVESEKRKKGFTLLPRRAGGSVIKIAPEDRVIFINLLEFEKLYGDDIEKGIEALEGTLTHEVGHVLGLVHSFEAAEKARIQAPECEGQPITPYIDKNIDGHMGFGRDENTRYEIFARDFLKNGPNFKLSSLDM